MTRANLNLNSLNVHPNADPSGSSPNPPASPRQAATNGATQLINAPGFSRGTIGLHLNSEQLVQALGAVLDILTDLHLSGRYIESPHLGCFRVQQNPAMPHGIQVVLSDSSQRRLVEEVNLKAMRRAYADVALQFNDLFTQKMTHGSCLLDGLTASRGVSELTPLLESGDEICSVDLKAAQRRMY